MVQRLVADLRATGIQVFLDRDSIQPGEYWQGVIRTAVREGDYFIACFSEAYCQRVRNRMNDEVFFAIEELRHRAPVSAWFIPVLLSGTVPDFPIGAGLTLRDIQYVELTSASWSEGVAGIVRTVLGQRTKANQFGDLQGNLSAWYPFSVCVVKCREFEDFFPVGSTWERGQVVSENLEYYKELYGFNSARDIWERGRENGALCIDRAGSFWFLRVVQIHQHGIRRPVRVLGWWAGGSGTLSVGV